MALYGPEWLVCGRWPQGGKCWDRASYLTGLGERPGGDAGPV